MKRRTLLSAAVALPCAARAQSATYPNKPIRLVIGFPAGGGAAQQAAEKARELTLGKLPRRA